MLVIPDYIALQIYLVFLKKCLHAILCVTLQYMNLFVKKGFKDYRRRIFLLIIPIFLNLDIQKYTTFAIKHPFIIVFHTGYIHN